MDLNNTKWIPMPNSNYIMKFVFEKTGYMIMITNFNDMYHEKANVATVLTRLRDLNPLVKFKLTTALEIIKNALLKSLNEGNLSVILQSSQLVMSLYFPQDDLFCKYHFSLELDNSQMSEHLVSPLIFTALLHLKKSPGFEESSSNVASDPINPEFLKGHVPPENLITTFLEIQNSTVTKNLESENLKAYNVQRRMKSKHGRKKVKVQAYWGNEVKNGRVYFPENFSGVDSLNVADKKPLSPIKEEVIIPDVTSRPKRNVKKRKIFM